MRDNNKEYLKYDQFILTFKNNSVPIIQTWQKEGKYEIGVSQLLYDLTQGKAKYVGNDGSSIEIAVPIGIFLKIKEDERFIRICSQLIRLRTTQRTLLSYLVHPINSIDNRL